jgi:hypothetical protein
MVGSYDFCDMHGESRTEKVMPVVVREGGSYQYDACNLSEHDFKSKSGTAYENANGTITLRVHSNCSYTLKAI